ncbi:MAG: hypothetical protein HN348_31925 [Proteobacteria bacterium]|nr:hypothetical protein [Pseudomonadota bacterium]
MLDHFVVEYGGGQGYANVFVYGCDATLSNGDITWSSTWGIYRGASANPVMSNMTYANNSSGNVF